MKLYKEVKASERLPKNTERGNTSKIFNVIDEDGIQHGDYYDFLLLEWANEWRGYKVDVWLEPFEIDENEIEEILYKFSSSQKDIGESLYLDIAKAIINLLK